MAQPMGSDDLRQQSLGELVKQLTEQTTRLVRNEVRLARAEMTEKAQAYGRAGAMLAAAAGVGLLTGFALTMFLIYLLRLALPLWAAALIVTVLYGVVALALFMTGKRKLDEAKSPVPEQTVESVKEDVQWLKTQTRSDAR
jgi:uncharacterized membrane protein YqjE